MPIKRSVEIFSAGCPACEASIQQIQDAACLSCEVTVLDMREQAVAARARRLGIRAVPAVVINGVLADCCAAQGPDLATLQAAGLGQA